MLYELRLLFAFILLLAGTFLVLDAVSSPDPTQTAAVIAGAVSFSLGLVTVSFVAKDWWEWRRFCKNHSRSVPN
jgi:hypothetical protein